MRGEKNEAAKRIVDSLKLYSMTSTAVAAGSRATGYAQVMRARMLGGSPLAQTRSVTRNILRERGSPPSQAKARVVVERHRRGWVRVRGVVALCDMIDGWVDGWMRRC